MSMPGEQALAMMEQSAAALEYAGANRRGVESVREALATIRAELDGMRADAERLDWLADEYASIEPFDMPTGQGDADVGWVVRQASPSGRGDVELYRYHFDDVRAAIDAARQEKGHE